MNGKIELKTTEDGQKYGVFVPSKPTYIKLDWDKVKTVEDIVLILKEVYPNTLLALQHDSFDKLKHLAMDEQSDK